MINWILCFVLGHEPICEDDNEWGLPIVIKQEDGSSLYTCRRCGFTSTNTIKFL